MESLKKNGEQVSMIFSGFIQRYPKAVDCQCQHVLDDAAVEVD